MRDGRPGAKKIRAGLVLSSTRLKNAKKRKKKKNITPVLQVSLFLTRKAVHKLTSKSSISIKIRKPTLANAFIITHEGRLKKVNGICFFFLEGLQHGI